METFAVAVMLFTLHKMIEYDDDRILCTVIPMIYIKLTQLRLVFTVPVNLTVLYLLYVTLILVIWLSKLYFLPHRPRATYHASAVCYGNLSITVTSPVKYKICTSLLWLCMINRFLLFPMSMSDLQESFEPIGNFPGLLS